jgi:hypothetical protein
MNTDPDQDPIQIQGFDDQKIKKIYSLKKIYFSLGLPKVHPSYRRSLQPLKENIQHFKLFSIFVGHYCSPDPYPKH